MESKLKYSVVFVHLKPVRINAAISFRPHGNIIIQIAINPISLLMIYTVLKKGLTVNQTR